MQYQEVLSALVAVILVYAIWFVVQIRKYPNGPIPIPIFGNLLFVRRQGPIYLWLCDVLRQKLYKDPITLWFGHKPILFVSSTSTLSQMHSGPKKAHFAGRMPTNFRDVFIGNSGDITFGDYNPHWSALRRVGHVAAIKFSKSNNFEELCLAITDQFVEESIKVGNVNGLADILLQNIIGVSAFGRGFQREDPYSQLVSAGFRSVEEDAPDMLPSDIWQPLRWLYWRQERQARLFPQSIAQTVDIFFDEAKNTYTPGVVRHFTDFVVAAREEAIAEERNTAQYLDTESIKRIVYNLFGAGIQTSRTAISWMLLTLANQPSVQDLLRRRITDVLGSKPPTSADRENLPEVMSFMYELFRCYPPVPLAVPHRTTCDTEINGHPIPKHTNFFINLYAASHDPDIWEKPHEFQWNRFIDKNTGKFSLDQIPAFIPFGVGPRSCIGEKMAVVELFCVITRIIQRCHLFMPQGPGSADLTPILSSLVCDPKPQIILVESL